LLRGLFRLQQVERLVQGDIVNRSRTVTLTQMQGRELSLAYRVGLAARLGLPSQPHRLNNQLSIEVSPQQLDHAYREVVSAEHTDALLESIREQQFWNDYLINTYQQQFLVIDERYALAFAALESQQNPTRQLADVQMRILFENFRNERRALMLRLTSEALSRNPGLPLVTGNTSEVQA